MLVALALFVPRSVSCPVSSHADPFVPPVCRLSSLVPMLGYLASFIAWSWSSIKSYDQGKGVILSATWLCPLLLITRVRLLLTSPISLLHDPLT